jgi:hypothetical protein
MQADDCKRGTYFPKANALDQGIDTSLNLDLHQTMKPCFGARYAIPGRERTCVGMCSGITNRIVIRDDTYRSKIHWRTTSVPQCDASEKGGREPATFLTLKQSKGKVDIRNSRVV